VSIARFIARSPAIFRRQCNFRPDRNLSFVPHSRARARGNLRAALLDDSDDSGEDSDDINFVGPGGKWEFLGEPTKRTARRKYYDVGGLGGMWPNIARREA
jgi:hypothetical protein